MRKLLMAAVAALALGSAAPAGAGGWATVGVAPLPPDEAGTAWDVQVTVLRHGRTPTDGAAPAVIVRNADGGKTMRFPAKPTGKTGVYAARIEFPSAGTWSYAVNDGLAATGYGESRTHTFAPVRLAAADGGSDSRTWAIAGSASLGLALAALLVFIARRRRRLEPVLPAAG